MLCLGSGAAHRGQRLLKLWLLCPLFPLQLILLHWKFWAQSQDYTALLERDTCLCPALESSIFLHTHPHTHCNALISSMFWSTLGEKYQKNIFATHYDRKREGICVYVYVYLYAHKYIIIYNNKYIKIYMNTYIKLASQGSIECFL